jgi:hypothetical protein
MAGGLVAGHRSSHPALHVHVSVVGHVEDYLDDVPSAEGELRQVLLADGVAAIVADAQPLSGQALPRGHRLDLPFRDDLLADVEPDGTDGFVVRARPLLGEVDEVGARGRGVDRERLLRWDAEKVVEGRSFSEFCLDGVLGRFFTPARSGTQEWHGLDVLGCACRDSHHATISEVTR